MPKTGIIKDFFRTYFLDCLKFLGVIKDSWGHFKMKSTTGFSIEMKTFLANLAE